MERFSELNGSKILKNLRILQMSLCTKYKYFKDFF
jgi:hypothetical protein